MKRLLIIGAAVLSAATLRADTHNVASGATETLNGVMETSRTVKSGAGTLVLSGDNSLATLTMNAGTLKINGGTTTLTTSTGGTNSNAPYEQKGGTIYIEGGAQFLISAPDHMVNWNGDLFVTNGVFDASPNEFLNGYYSSSSGRLIVQDKGVFKIKDLRVTQTGTASLVNNVGVFLNSGGELHVSSLVLYGNRYGVVRYNGGKIYKVNAGTDEKKKYNLYNSYDNATWENVKSYVDEGGFHLVNDTDNTIYVNRPLLSGAANDGGVHYSSSKGRWISLSDVFTNSTFNGGTWLEGRVALINYREDAAFGAVPASPTDNIFFSGTPEYFGGGQNYTIHRNRNIKLLDGATATFGCNSEGSGLRIGGTISVPDGEGYTTNTMFNAGNGSWGGFIVFDPGEGRTNRLDRLHVPRNLEIASGVTIVRSPSSGLETNAPLYVEGNNSAYTSGYNSYGNLKITGGKLVVEGSRYIEANKYAQVIVEGGTFSALTTYCEYLNGLSDRPATLTVGNGGVFEVYKMRISQGGSVGSDVNINTGGVLRTAYFFMDNYSAGRLNLNGGTIAVYSDSMVSAGDKLVFLGGKGATATKDSWKNVTVRVLAGGAKFDTAGYSRSVNTPLLSAVGEGETDGGLTKLGEGTLTMTTNNTYNGVTRLEGGTLKFTHVNGLPDGDIEFSAAGLASCTNAPLLTAKTLAFRAGCGIRVTECDTLDSETWQGKWHTVATFQDDIAALPSVTFVKSDGTVAAAENGWDNWTFRISANRKSFEFRRLRGTTVIIF